MSDLIKLAADQLERTNPLETSDTVAELVKIPEGIPLEVIQEAVKKHLQEGRNPESALSVDRAELSGAISKAFKIIGLKDGEGSAEFQKELQTAEGAVREYAQSIHETVGLLVNMTGVDASESWPVGKQGKALHSLKKTVEALTKLKASTDFISKLERSVNYFKNVEDLLTDVIEQTEKLPHGSELKLK
jgi:hypothetical protein